MQTSSDQPFDSELHHLHYQLATIQEQHRRQTYLIEQFQQQLKSYQDNERSRSATFSPLSTLNQPAILRPSDDDEDEEEEEDCSTLSPLDLSSTSTKSDEDHSSFLIQFQMESHEGEPENPHMSKVR